MNNANDDKSPLIDLLTCIVCKVTMKIASSTPESSGSDLVQYRCEQCGWRGWSPVADVAIYQSLASPTHLPVLESIDMPSTERQATNSR